MQGLSRYLSFCKKIILKVLATQLEKNSQFEASRKKNWQKCKKINTILKTYTLREAKLTKMLQKIIVSAMRKIFNKQVDEVGNA